ncbi:MAG: NAD(P)/FAD-dependent oxidoreductase [Deltaproteobacteria bacterium]|nr:NAD(P)/FAD-dependent oxidoreductase [Deltaproteobacteria bacterium]MBW2538256.1 NAD(P)/FAD-dependent oxidoreductase [Deltaproteobacteria bacterium]
MKRIVILGSGAGGTMVAAKLRHKLSESEWEITIIDNDEIHHYQPGWLFIPFGVYTAKDCAKPKRDFIPPGVDFVLDEVVSVDTDKRQVQAKNGSYNYDWLVIATGCRIVPEEVEGMMDDWRGNIHDFFTLEGAVELYKKFKYLDSGRVVLNIAELPYKCPVAPIEFIFMADWFFKINGVRDNIEIEMVSPLGDVFTKPVAAKIFGDFATMKNIKFTGNFDIAQVNAKEKTIESHKGDKVPYDLLVAIPPNFGAQFIEDSGMGDPMCYVDTDNFTLKAKNYDHIYVIGDATNVPASKAGAVAHYESDTVVENLVREIDGQEPKPTFDGHATCFICSGYEKALLIDFNYKTEPLPGKFPFPGIGPFDLLGESNFNYYGKMMFKWVYWNLMLKGNELPLENQMTMAGKMRQGI